ncbi:hypothetical protein EVAR_55123_1 [Eumeta japonica]|uniref:Uncharacterized protein n=1 Tax=Eumeta variegata TaxID=151549 RepID=A0A4C1YDC3_EUMVA|nr:hypothetical protein EVAR_55123_1 [Eumeta japonica]
MNESRLTEHIYAVLWYSKESPPASKKAKPSPKKSPKGSKKVKTNVKPQSPNKRKSAGSTPTVASTSKTATAVMEKTTPVKSAKTTPNKKSPAKQSKVETPVKTPKTRAKRASRGIAHTLDIDWQDHAYASKASRQKITSPSLPLEPLIRLRSRRHTQALRTQRVRQGTHAAIMVR